MQKRIDTLQGQGRLAVASLVKVRKSNDARDVTWRSLIPKSLRSGLTVFALSTLRTPSSTTVLTHLTTFIYLFLLAGCVVRTPKYFTEWISASFRINPGVLVAALDKKGALVGYLALRTKEPPMLKEFIPGEGGGGGSLILTYSLVLIMYSD